MSIPSPANAERLTELELAAHLASALGETKALEVVQSARSELRIPGGSLRRDQVLAVLDAIATEPGLVGITARFVKSRLSLQWGD